LLDRTAAEAAIEFVVPRAFEVLYAEPNNVFGAVDDARRLTRSEHEKAGDENFFHRRVV
jgi:hypothetical protein